MLYGVKRSTCGRPTSSAERHSPNDHPAYLQPYLVHLHHHRLSEILPFMHVQPNIHRSLLCSTAEYLREDPVRSLNKGYGVWSKPGRSGTCGDSSPRKFHPIHMSDSFLPRTVVTGFEPLIFRSGSERSTHWTSKACELGATCEERNPRRSLRCGMRTWKDKRTISQPSSRSSAFKPNLHCSEQGCLLRCSRACRSPMIPEFIMH